MRLELAEGWRVVDSNPGAGDAAAFSQPGFNAAGWHTIQVPGDVNAALLRDGRIPDPQHRRQRQSLLLGHLQGLVVSPGILAGPDGFPQAVKLVLDGVDGPPRFTSTGGSGLA